MIARSTTRRINVLKNRDHQQQLIIAKLKPKSNHHHHHIHRQFGLLYFISLRREEVTRIRSRSKKVFVLLAEIFGDLLKKYNNNG